MSLLFRFVYITIIFIFANMHGVYAGSVPITVESDLLGVLPYTERNTCDPAFWEVVKDRAWMEAQREITQNNNLIPRADSVLSTTCFDQKLNHLTWYGDRNFPGEPSYAEGKIGGLFTTFLYEGDKFISDGDPMLPGSSTFVGWPLGRGGSATQGGLVTGAVLEMLTLDALVDNVSSAGDVLDIFTLLGVCTVLGEDKNYYLDENFPNLMLGGRARAVSGTPGPAWPILETRYGVNGNVERLSYSPYNGCARMNNIWMRSKCSDFATESAMHIAQAVPLPPPPPSQDHDGFYTLEQYRDTAAAGNDYRRKDMQCPIPMVEGLPDIDFLGSEFLCDLSVHGLLNVGINIGTLIGIVTALNNDNPIWATVGTDIGAFDGAYPTPDPTPLTSTGAVDEYVHFLGLRDATDCAALTPIKTGYIVQLTGGVTYEDAVCPAPGCWFDPPSLVGPDGNCIQP